MGQKITEHPQVDYWVKLTREADKAGARLPVRGSADARELSQYAEMERARTRSAFSVILPASMTTPKAHVEPDEATAEDARVEPEDADEATEYVNSEAPGDSGEDEGDGEADAS